MISARGVSKKFNRQTSTSTWRAIEDLMARMIAPQRRAAGLQNDEFWALDDVGFEISRGESVGIVGNNGAGKSTLLKLLMRRMMPTRGRIETRGKLAAITELGLGFNPVLSGRENVFFNAALLGMPRARTSEMFQSIVDFADLSEFIDSPVQTYSTGMRARLGYAVAAHLQPDILLVDELLAVGDLMFRRKCRRHMQAFHQAHGTLVLVSHDMQAIQTLCQRCLVLDHGRLVFDGSATDGVHYYLRLTAEREAQAPAEESPLSLTSIAAGAEDDAFDAGQENPEEARDVTKEGLEMPIATEESPAGPSVTAGEPVARDATTDWPAPGIPSEAAAQVWTSDASTTAVANAAISIRQISIAPINGAGLCYDQPARITVRFESHEVLENVVFGFTICTSDLQTHIASGLTGFDGHSLHLARGPHEWSGTIRRLPLRAGRYALKVGLGELGSGAALADVGWETSPCYFTVSEGPSSANNIHGWLRDLVGIDVEWEFH